MLSILDTPCFITQQAADAACVSQDTLAAQLRRGEIDSAESDPPALRNPGPGRSRRFSPRRVLHIALAEALVRVGLSTKQASRLALRFSDWGGSSADRAVIEGEPMPPVRLPGHLLPDGTVFRVLFHSDGREPVASVDHQAEALAHPFVLNNTRYESMVLIDLDDLVFRVLASLRLPQDCVL
jgi:hypothetical protein